MRLFRFYNERHNLRKGSSVLLAKEEAEHLRKSLRLKKGDSIIIFNGEKEYEAILKQVTNEVTMAEIVKERRVLASNKPTVTAFIGLTKAPSFELTLEKLTELGIDTIVPIQTEYGVVKVDHKVEKKMQRWRKIILEACKQSERISIPELLAPIEFREISKDTLSEFDAIAFFTTKITKEYTTISSLNLSTAHSIAFFIGLEGGFSPQENDHAEALGVPLVTLGENILKAETAAIAGMSVIQYAMSEDKE